MPAVTSALIEIAYTAATAAEAAATALGPQLTTALVSTALGTAVSLALSYAFAPAKPKSAKDVQDQISTTSQRNIPVAVVLGRGRVGGNMIAFPGGSGAVHYWGTDAADNGGRIFLIHSILGLCEGVIQAAGNIRIDGKPKITYYQELVDKKLTPQFDHGTEIQQRDSTFYMDFHMGTATQPVPGMMTDTDTTIAAGRENVATCGYTVDDGDGGLVLAESKKPLTAWRNTALAACQLYTGYNIQLASVTVDIMGPDLSLHQNGTTAHPNTHDTAYYSIYDAYTESFYWTVSASDEDTPFGIIRIDRGLHGRDHTQPPSYVTDNIVRGWYLGRHDVVVFQDPNDGSLFHIGCWGIARSSDIWERVRPHAGTGIPGGYDHPMLVWHLDELSGILHSLHDDGTTRYVMRWWLLTGRVERMDTDLESDTFRAMMFSPDANCYLFAGATDLTCMGASMGDTIHSTSAITLTDCKGLFVSGNRAGVVTTTGCYLWDMTDPDTTFGPYGSADNGTSSGSFGNTVTAVQNTLTGQVTLVKPSSSTVAHINFIPSVLESVEDIRARGTPHQPDFQNFFGFGPNGPTHTWTTGYVEEPFYRKVDPPTSQYRRTSPTFSYSVSADTGKLVFGDGTRLDDVLILIKPGESVTDDWNGTDVRPHVTFTIPANSIIIANNTGSFMSADNATFYETCQKTFTDGTHVVELPVGSHDSSVTDNYTLFQAASYDVETIADGITRATLAAKGFITGSTLAFKLVHIVCGAGDAHIYDMGVTSDENPSIDPDTVAGWIRDWSFRTYNTWELNRLEGNSSLVAALWNVLVDVSAPGATLSNAQSGRWGGGLSRDYFDLPSFEGLHARCVAGWKYANTINPVTGSDGTPISYSATYRWAERYKLDYTIDTQTSLSDMCTNQILACCNGFRWMVGGKMHVGLPLPGIFPVWHFQDDRILDTPSVGFTGRSGLVNRVRVQYREVGDEYRINIADANDEYDQERSGRVADQTLILNGIGRPGQASLVATNVLDDAISTRRSIEFKTQYLGYVVTCGDVIECSYRNSGLSRTKARVSEFAEDENRAVKISSMEHKPSLMALSDSSSGAVPGTSVSISVGAEQEHGSCEEQTGSTGSGVRWFNGGAAYVPGCYDVFYVDNCYKLADDDGSFAVEGYDIVTRDSSNVINVLLAAPAVANPPDGWSIASDAVTANTGQNATFTLSDAGPIGLQLRDPPKFTNFADLGPAPTYMVCVCGDPDEPDESSAGGGSGSGSSGSDSVSESGGGGGGGGGTSDSSEPACAEDFDPDTAGASPCTGSGGDVVMHTAGLPHCSLDARTFIPTDATGSFGGCDPDEESGGELDFDNSAYPPPDGFYSMVTPLYLSDGVTLAGYLLEITLQAGAMAVTIWSGLNLTGDGKGVYTRLCGSTGTCWSSVPSITIEAA